MASARENPIISDLTSQANQNRKISILEMPDMLINIFVFLPLSDATCMSLVCKIWAESQSAPFWEYIYKRDRLDEINSYKCQQLHSFFYVKGKLNLANIKMKAIKTFSAGLLHHSIRADNCYYRLLNEFMNLPDYFFIALHRKLLPDELMCIEHMNNRINTLIDFSNFARIKRIFECHALTLLLEKSLDKAFMKNVIYHLALSESTAESEPFARYERAFVCLELGKLVFLKKVHQEVFDIIPENFLQKLNGDVFQKILDQVNSGEELNVVIENVCGSPPARRVCRCVIS